MWMYVCIRVCVYVPVCVMVCSTLHLFTLNWFTIINWNDKGETQHLRH